MVTFRTEFVFTVYVKLKVAPDCPIQRKLKNGMLALIRKGFNVKNGS